MPKYRALIHASEILTGAGLRKKNGRRPQEEDLGRILDGALVYSYSEKKGRESARKIEWIGPTEKLPAKFQTAKKTNLRGQNAVVPGLVDCHNHLVFAGDRSAEFAERCAGATYEEIAAKGGGILTTMRATRQATEEELERLGSARIDEAWRFGVRTLEIKTGYGLSEESEMKVLRVIRTLKKKFPEMRIQSTYLGAHAFPPDQNREHYIREMIESTIPKIATGKTPMADACDVFIDRGYFTRDEGKVILEKAKSLGLKIKIHADELAETDSAKLGVELGALSVDHLLKISDVGIQALAQSETVGVLLPGTAFYLKAPYAPARKLIDAGAIIALATDFNPGSCMCNSLPAVMNLAALYMGMSRAEIFAGVTFNAAKALGLEKWRGTLEKGMDAAFTILPFSRFEETYYRFAWAP